MTATTERSARVDRGEHGDERDGVLPDPRLRSWLALTLPRRA